MLHASLSVFLKPLGETGDKRRVGLPPSEGFKGEPLDQFTGLGIIMQQGDMTTLNRPGRGENRLQDRPPLGVEGALDFQPVDPDRHPGVHLLLGPLEMAEIVGNVRPTLLNFRIECKPSQRLPGP